MIAAIFKYSILHRLCIDYILKFAHLKKKDKVLDAGCGIGIITDEVAQKARHAIGIDINQKSIAFAKKNMLGEYKVMSLEKMSFPDRYFDKVICCAVLEHVDNPAAVIAEFNRITKSGGYLIIAVPCSSGILNGTWLNRLGHTEKKGGEYHVRDGFYFKELKKLLEENGFHVVQKKYFNFLFAELITQISKFYSFKIKKIRYSGQADIRELEKSFLFSIYKLFFPFLYTITLVEDASLAPLLKGHALIIGAVKR